MFNVMKKLYGIYTPEVISSYKTQEEAVSKCNEAKRKHERNLSAFGWNSYDGTEFYVEEI